MAGTRVLSEPWGVVVEGFVDPKTSLNSVL